MSQEERNANVKFYPLSLNFLWALEKPENSRAEEVKWEVKEQMFPSLCRSMVQACIGGGKALG